jgi:SAM-dependent methyltransferase
MLHIFDRSGLASLDDLNDIEAINLFNELETHQSIFSRFEGRFLGEAYKWPRKPLYWWSRCWEYPYVLHHIKKWRKDQKSGLPKIVDLGCGVTFFPFSIATENCAVVGVDIDPVAEQAIVEAAKYIPISNGSVSFKLTNGESLPFEDHEIDALYCISVLEHIPNPCVTIKEIARVLKKGGLFVLTLDVDLKGNYDIGPDKFNSLISTIHEHFVLNEHERTIHPTKLLKSDNGPYPWNVEVGIRKYIRPLKEFIKFIFRRTKFNKLELACYGVVLLKK